MIDLGVARGQHMTLQVRSSERCSLGVVVKFEEVNNIAACAAGPCLLSSWVARPRMECGQEQEECASSKVTGVDLSDRSLLHVDIGGLPSTRPPSL